MPNNYQNDQLNKRPDDSRVEPVEAKKVATPKAGVFNEKAPKGTKDGAGNFSEIWPGKSPEMGGKNFKSKQDFIDV